MTCLKRMGVRTFSRTCLVLSLLFSAFTLRGKDNAGHVRDAVDFLLGGARSAESREVVEFVSQGMDMGSGAHPLALSEKGSSFLSTLRADFTAKGFNGLEGLGAHRAIGHWGFGGGIPGDFMAEVRKTALELAKQKEMASAEAESFAREMEHLVKRRWIEFVKTRTAAVKQAFGLVGKQGDKVAHSIAALIFDMHLLGDHTTKDVLDLPRLKTLANDIYRNLPNVFGKELTAEIKQAIWTEARGLTGRARAGKIIEILRRYGKTHWATVERILRQAGYSGRIAGIDYALLRKIVDASEAVLNSKALELVRQFASRVEECRVVKSATRLGDAYADGVDKVSRRLAEKADASLKGMYARETVASMKNVDAVKTVTGFLQEVTLADGRTVLVLSVPKERLIDGFKTGINSGVATFILLEGVTFYQFARGEISDRDFAWESAKNGAAALVTGTGTFVAVALGAAPCGFVVLAVGVGGCLVCDIVFRELRLAVEGPHVDLDDILGGCPTEIERRLTAFDLVGEGANAADRVRYRLRLRQEAESGCLWRFCSGRACPLSWDSGRAVAFEYDPRKPSALDYAPDRPMAFDFK